MAFDRERLAEQDESTVVLPPAEQAEPEWPVSDFYRVGFDETREPGAEPEQTELLVVATPGAERGRLRISRRPAAATAAALALVALALVALLALGVTDPPGERETAAAARPASPSPKRITTSQAPDKPSVGKILLARLTGLSLEEARALLARDELRLRATEMPSEREQGLVLSQSPEPGKRLRKGDLVALTVSAGPTENATPTEVAEVPRVVGLGAPDAVVAIRAVGLVPRLRMVSSTRPAGTVLRQRPNAGSEVEPGATVELEVARSATTVALPQVVDLDVASAKRELRAAGFHVEVVAVLSASEPRTVVAQAPRGGTQVRRGSFVRLSVSSGPGEISVPDVTGLDAESARVELEAAGFQVRIVEESVAEPASDGVVLRQTPAGGLAGREGAVVTIVVGRYA